jgi:hypothetical protein
MQRQKPPNSAAFVVALNVLMVFSAPSASSPETHFQPLEIVILSPQRRTKNLLFSGARTKAAGPSSAVADSG